MNTPTPRLQLCFYDELITLTHYQGQQSSTYPVSGQDVAVAFSDLSLSTGLLPANTLSWRHDQGHTCLLIYIPPRRHKIVVQVAGQLERYKVPFPGLVFRGHQRTYHIWAVKKQPALSLSKGPSSPQTLLYRFPSPNVYSHGRICTGNVPFPACACDTIHAAFEQFISSPFNNHLTGGKAQSHSNILDLWQALRDKKRFPLRQLIPTNKTLRYIL